MGWVHPRTNEIVAGLPGVKAALKETAGKQKSKVMAKAAGHVETGWLIEHISVEEHDKGYAIVFTDPNIISINYGHWLRKSKNGPPIKWVEGIHIIEEGLH
ncbi:DUF5403 family protein [Streptomyces yunnanensis]|uniref:Uncharacterized protein n=1 Tax=Streptomyces yunnanensis TaxID=156453 RepID=A0A9X8N7W2_9ACTN|nr:DUF5403 family protein [Streptomyces yunnanensis]SHN24741.1 hypothetical protein SAMN05216268_126132 [Streptomyces yunnanensis]